MEQLLSLAALSVLGALCALTLRRQVPELARVLAIVTGLVLLGAAMELLREVRTFLEALAELAGLTPELLAPLAKTVAATIVTRVTAELCRDAGERGIAAFTELVGGAAAICATLPLVRAVMDMVAGLL